MSQLLGVIQGTFRDTSSLALGIPTVPHLIVGSIVFLCIILIWVGASMAVSQMVASDSTPNIAYGRGGLVLLTGLIGLTAVHYYRTKK